MPLAKDSLNESQLKDFQDRFVPQAETVNEYLGTLTGSAKEAYQLTKLTFQNLLSDFHRTNEQESAKLVCLERATEAFFKAKPESSGILSKLSPKEKVSVVLTECFGVSVQEIAEMLSCELVTSRALLASGRKSLMSGSLKHGSEKEKSLVIGYMSDYLGEEIPDKKLLNFKKALSVVEGEKPSSEDLEDSPVVQAFIKMRYELDAVRAKFALDLDQIESIQILAEEPKSILAREHKALEILGVAESKQLLLRWLLAIIILVGVGCVLLLGQSRIEQSTKDFDPLLYLGNETEAFEYDYRNRLDFPVRGIEEVYNFLKTRKQVLGHNPVVLSPPIAGVNVLGASVLDYDPRKVSAVLYLDERSLDLADSGPEVVALYCYDGNFKSLEKAPQTNKNGQTFQSYTSKRFNMVAFENGEETICMLMGRMSGADLLKMASQRY